MRKVLNFKGVPDGLIRQAFGSSDGTNELSRFESGMRAENERLKPVLLAMVEIVRLSEMVITEVHAQKVLWPAEVDTLEDCLARLREAVEECK